MNIGPILDMQFWIEDKIVMYSFYKKACASPFTIMKRSAIGESTKRTSIFQEGIRRLTNTSLKVPKETIVNIMAEYSNMLRLSGYSEQFRYNTENGVMTRWNTVLDDVSKGNRVLHKT